MKKCLQIQDECILAKILVEAQGTELSVGSPIAITVEDRDAYEKFLKLDPASYAIAATPAGAAAKSVPASAPPAAAVTPAATAALDASRIRISPAARHIIESNGLNASEIAGLSSLPGRGNTVLVRKEDVIRSMSAGSSPAKAASAQVATSSVPQPILVAAPAAAVVVTSPAYQEGAEYKDIPNNNVRKVIAKRLSESKATVPHTYTTMECNIDALMEFRKSLKKEFEVNVSVNDLIIKSAALALRDVPEANSRWDAATHSVKKPLPSPSGGAQIDISVAVATPSGLITPIVFGADRRGLSDISSTVLAQNN